MTATAIGAYTSAARIKTRANISDTTDDTLLGTIADQINQYIESKTHRVLAPISSTTYYYDGDGGRTLWLPFPASGGPASGIGGIRAVSLLETALYTSAAYVTVDSSQYFLRGNVGQGGPFERLEWTDYPTSTYPGFPRGFNTVRLTGTAGWAAIPDDISEVADVAGIRAWTARQAGQSDIVGTDEFGRPLVSRFFSSRDRETLAAYSTDIPA